MKKKIFFLWLLAAMCFSCKTTQPAVSIDQRDSVRVEYVQIHDTLTVRDTVTVTVKDQTVQEENAGIQFGAGGGTYNAKTGEATNVVGVTLTSREEELREENISLVSQLTQITSERDSLATEVSQLEQEIVPCEECKVPKYYKFTSWAFWIIVAGCLLVIAWKIFKKHYLRI